MAKSVIDRELQIETVTTYNLFYCYTGERDWGYGFECDESGIVDESTMNPLALDNYRKVLAGETHRPVNTPVLRTFTHTIRLCPCGSGEYPEDVYDARGIYVACVCDKCRKERLRGYRLEIFDDSDYECDEPIEPDGDYEPFIDYDC